MVSVFWACLLFAVLALVIWALTGATWLLWVAAAIYLALAVVVFLFLFSIGAASPCFASAGFIQQLRGAAGAAAFAAAWPFYEVRSLWRQSTQ
jgi:hypothetical protein